MSFANDILDAIEIMVKQVVEDNATKIYTGVCKTIGVNNCVLTINGKDNTVKYYGGVPVVGTVYQVFIPFGNMSAAFIIVPGSGGGSGGSGVDSVNGKTGDVVLNAADVGLGNVDNIKQYSASNPPPYPVVSVNGKTGSVNLIASDVGAAPAGYGYGDKLQSIGHDNITEDDFVAALELVYSKISDNTVKQVKIIDHPTLDGGAHFGHLWRSDKNYGALIVYSYFGFEPAPIIRVKSSGVWKSWEYVNPPMKLGVEYRTTERYQGKPVYVKLVDFGALPNTASKYVNPNISNFGTLTEPMIVKITQSDGGINETPYVTDTAIRGRAWFKMASGGICIRTMEDCSSSTAYVKLKYTKTTD